MVKKWINGKNEFLTVNHNVQTIDALRKIAFENIDGNGRK